MTNNVIQFPGVGTYMYNVNRLYKYESSLRRHKQFNEADIVAHCAALYDQGLIGVDWDPADGSPILVSLKILEADDGQ